MALFLFQEPQIMPVDPFARDADPRPSDGRREQADAAAVPPEMRASPREEPKEPAAEEMIEEPGYGHGV
jgi:hypothetical protein